MLTVPHGFSLRQGGVSVGPLASLNLGDAVGDAAENVAENLRRLAAEAGRSPIQLATVAAVHSGWRGTALRVASRAVEALVRTGATASSVCAVVGPCIQACCYEVGPELAERFRAEFGSQVVRDGGVRPHLDLSAAVRATLLAAGLSADNVDLQPACTACDGTRFYSHRRDGGVTGRHLSFIAPTPLS